MGVPGVIRPCAFCLVKEGGSFLIGRYVDPDHEAPFYRPLGGGILFGESGDEAVRREFREELGIELGAVAFLGFIENLFVMGSERYHELCLIFGAEPDGWSLERFHAFEIQESISETAIVIEAQDIEGVTPFYPDGVETVARRFMNTSNE
jgi:8-oxo-dGTP pyrophosphatase MutT (NUDIX family)